MSLRHASVLFTLALALVACTSTPVEEFDLAGSKPDGGGRCTPGDTQSCVCLGGGTGTQTCRASGASFGPCTACMGTVPSGDMAMPTGPCANCQGCCDNNTCLPFASQTMTKCGMNGQTCTGCTGGKVCSTTTGACIDSTCTGCAFGALCTSGTCTMQIDPAALFRIQVKYVAIKYYDYSSDPDGDYWDGVPGNVPEPQATFYYQAGGGFKTGTTGNLPGQDNAAKMAYDATFDATNGIAKTPEGADFKVPGSVLIAGTLHVVAQDNDGGLNWTDDDTAQDVSFPANNMLKAEYATGAVTPNLVELRFEIKQ